MKITKINLVGFILFLGISIKAQEFKYGAEIGVDISKPQFSNYSEDKGCFCGPWRNSDFYAMPSANINGFIELKVNDIWAVTAEPGFISKSGYLKPTTLKTSDKMYVYNNYIQLPFLFNFYIKKKLFFSAGTEIAFFTFKTQHVTNKYQEPSPYEIKKIELSGLIGIGYAITDNIDLGLKYSRGLTNINKSSASQYGSLYNQYAQLFVRYKK